MDKGVHTFFFKGISIKMNVIEHWVFEIAFKNIAVQHASHYTTETLD